MTDFHTHILPGMDDGSRSLSESIAMLREEARQGITTVALTPHFYAWENSPDRFLERRQQAYRVLEPHLEPQWPRLRLGAEVHYFEGIQDAPDMEALRLEGTEYLLLEMPLCAWSRRMLGGMLELNERPEIRVVLAHAERYFSMQPKDLWQRLQARGIRLQCNVSFLTGWRTGHRAVKMLKNGQIAFLGSDCHNMEQRCPNWERLPDRLRCLARERTCSPDENEKSWIR